MDARTAEDPYELPGSGILYFVVVLIGNQGKQRVEIEQHDQVQDLECHTSTECPHPFTGLRTVSFPEAVSLNAFDCEVDKHDYKSDDSEGHLHTSFILFRVSGPDGLHPNGLIPKLYPFPRLFSIGHRRRNPFPSSWQQRFISTPI